MALPDFGVIVSLFGRLGRALQRLVLGVLDNPGPDPVAELEEAEELAREAAQEAREATLEWIEGAGPEFYAEALTEGGGGEPSPEQAQSRDLTLQELASTLLRATRTMEDSAKASVRRIARRRVEAAMAGGSAREEAEAFRAELVESGIRVTDSAGRIWEPGHYSRMVLRTLTGELRNQGSLHAAQQIGSIGVRIRDGKGDDSTDEPCVQADGEAWSLPYFSTHLLQHPNCTRAAAPLAPGYTGELDRS